MPAVLALPAFWAAVGGATAAGGAIYAANKTSGATEQAAQLQSGATNTATAAQAKATADALAFSKQQAENEYQTSEAALKANYDLSAAREGSLGAAAAAAGVQRAPMPAFVPMPDPNFTSGAPAGSVGGAATPATTTSGTPAGSVGSTAQPNAAGPGASPTGDPVMDALTKNYSALGVKPTGPGSGPTDIAYYAQKIAETGGPTPQNLAYWMGPQGRIAQDLAKATGGGGNQAGAASPAAGSLGSYGGLYPSAPSILTPALTAPPPPQMSA